MKPILRKHVAATLMLLAPLGAVVVAQPAAAQHAPQYRVAQVELGRFTNLGFNSDSGLAPGATLRVQAVGTPGARWANATLGDSGIRIALRERTPGEYVGTHVIRRGERIDPRQAITLRGAWSDAPVAVTFDYPASFQALAMGSGAANGNAVVQAFTMSPSEGLEPGEVVRFRVEGTPGARAWVNLPDNDRDVRLQEVRPGVYVGNYTIRRRDDADTFSRARAVLRSGDQRVVAHLDTGRRYGMSNR